MSTYLLVDNATKSYGDVVLFENITFTVIKGQKIALLAKNGAGKTSLLNILIGKDSFDSGNYYIDKDLNLGYLKQDPQFDPELTVFEAAFGASGNLMQTVREYEQAVHDHDENRLQEAIHQMDFYNAWDYDQRIKTMLSVFKLGNLEQKVKTLSGGQVKRLALAVSIINEPDFLILDEPTNHLDLDMIEWLEEFLNKTQSTILMVTHDRYFLDRVCNEILELDELGIYSYKGNYSYYLEKRNERLLSKNQLAEKAQNLMRKELEWMRRMPKARTHKAKYRIDAFYSLKDQADYRRNDKQVDINVKSSRLGNKILEMEHVNKRFGDLVVLDDFTYTFSRFEKVGIVGQNGVGKSTFLNLITQQLLPDSGKIDTGETVVYGFYQQQGLAFKSGQKVIEIIKEIADYVTLGSGEQMSVSQFLTHFLFPPEMQYVSVDKLSGGEKRRLYLMTILMKSPNFLILDEPTNDLDIVTLNVLEDYLQNFGGCLIVVSHDRFFIDKVVDHLFIFEGDGQVFDFPGNYSEYRASVRLQEQEDASALKNEILEKKKLLEPSKIEVTADKKKLTFKEKKELEQLEKDLELLEGEKTALEEGISSGVLIPDELIAKSNRLGVVLKLLDEKTDRWLELSSI